MFDEQLFVIPTLYARVDDSIIIHGSSISRMLENIEIGVKVCVTVTLIDGLVLARSAFHHSMNYRSAVIFGTGKLIENDDEKLTALKAVSDNILPQRWEDSRQPTENELNITSVLKIEIEEASAKIREGDPVDDAKDYELPIWAGILPFETKFGEPIADAKLDKKIELPDYLKF
jgi:nitroimidazol reductase NimA-like FMN-containing flavoprotein (pyridoxamine 5'-phosphate oxidase superfamily)